MRLGFPFQSTIHTTVSERHKRLIRHIPRAGWTPAMDAGGRTHARAALKCYANWRPTKTTDDETLDENAGMGGGYAKTNPGRLLEPPLLQSRDFLVNP